MRATAIVRDGLLAACGSLKAAAITMGMDQGQLTRELQSGAFKFERLDRLSGAEIAVVVEYLHDAYAPMTDPRSFVLQALEAIEAEVATIRKFIEQLPCGGR